MNFIAVFILSLGSLLILGSCTSAPKPAKIVFPETPILKNNIFYGVQIPGPFKVPANALAPADRKDRLTGLSETSIPDAKYHYDYITAYHKNGRIYGLELVKIFKDPEEQRIFWDAEALRLTVEFPQASFLYIPESISDLDSRGLNLMLFKTETEWRNTWKQWRRVCPKPDPVRGRCLGMGYAVSPTIYRITLAGFKVHNEFIVQVSYSSHEYYEAQKALDAKLKLPQ